MTVVDKRKHRRLMVNLDISCREVGSKLAKAYFGRAVNASPGGLYFETDSYRPELGRMLEIQLSIPPKSGEFEKGGRITGFAKVLRTCNVKGLDSSDKLATDRCGVALEFCRSPKFCL